MQKKIAKGVLGLILTVSLVGCGSGNGSAVYTDMNEGVRSKLVTLGDYKDLSYTLEEVNVTDEDVESEIESELEWYEEYEEIDRTTAEEGDVVNIDFAGKVDGEEMENGSSEDYDLELGSGDFIPGFEEQIIGKEKGSRFQVEVTFPDEYDADLAGKDAVFDVTLNKIQKAVPAELTDAFVKENMDCETVEEYRQSVKEDLISSMEEENRSKATGELLEQIIAGSEFEIDQSDIDKAVDEQIENYQSYADMYGMDMEEFCQSFFGYGSEQLREESRQGAEDDLKSDLILGEIAKRENLGITQKEYEDAVKQELEDYGYETVEEFEEEYGKEEYMYNLLYEKVLQYLLDNSKKNS